MVGMKTQWIATLSCSLVILSSVAAVAGHQTTSRTGVKTDAPTAVVVPAATERRNATLKVEILRVQTSGDKDVETEVLNGLVGSRMSSTGMTARGWPASLSTRTIRAQVREVKEGLVYVDFDYDETSNTSRDATPERQFATTVALKDGETTTVKSYAWKSTPSQAGAKETSVEQMVFLTVHVSP